MRVCLNGNEWLKQQLRKEAIPFDSLDNGFLWCADPERLQHLADSLGPADVQAFFDHWLERLPWPLTPADRAAGYRHRLSIWQLEMSLTQVFSTPVYGRHFFEAVIRDNLDLGRPDRVSLLFPTRLRRNTPPPDRGYKTRVITYGVAPSLHVEFKHAHVKQYFKEQRALRTETTINDPLDFQRTKGLDTLPHLRAIGGQINAKLLDVERVADGVIPAPSFFERLQLPTLSPTGQRVSALRFGDPRAQALFGALCHFSHLPSGFRNGDLRPAVAALMGRDLATYSAGAMTYDLRRLRLHGVIADDHPVFRFGVRSLVQAEPDLELVGEAATGLEAIASAETLRPDVVLIDLNMPGLNGIEATRRIQMASPGIAVLVVSMLEDSESIFAAMQAGARGYVLKGPMAPRPCRPSVQWRVVGRSSAPPWRSRSWPSSPPSRPERRSRTRLPSYPSASAKCLRLLRAV